MLRFRSFVFAAALAVPLAGCGESSPPDRTSPVLQAVDAPFEPACRHTARPSGGYVLGCDGSLWRLTDGPAKRLADGGPTATQDLNSVQPPFAIGDDESAWALDPATGLVHAWDGASWTVHDIPAAIGFEWDPSIVALAARSQKDAYALLYVDQGLQVLCHWDGTTWTSQELSDVGAASIHVTPSFVFVQGDELSRLAPDGSSEVVDLGPDYHDTIAFLGDESILLGSSKGLFHWNGTEIQRIYEGPELQYFVARTEDDVWGVWREEDGACLESDIYSSCQKDVSYWRQYRALHWDGASLVETGHVDRLDDLDVWIYLGGGASPELLVPAGERHAWLNVEGWVEASR